MAVRAKLRESVNVLPTAPAPPLMIRGVDGRNDELINIVTPLLYG
jgi:hypothetical protein